MNKEQTELLFKDLCGRLPYKVYVQIYNHWRDEYEYETLTLKNYQELIDTFCVEDIKPYLLPLSSMTEEQSREYCHLQQKIIYNSKGIVNKDITEYINWCYKNHLDVNDLTPKGLAIDATGKNIY